MRHRLLLLGLLLGLAPFLHAKPSIAIGSQVFLLADQQEASQVRLREFLMPGETFEHWTQLVAVREFEQIDDPQQYIGMMAKEYHAKRPHMQFGVFKKDDPKEFIIDFLEYPDTGESFVEWNVFRAKKAKKGIVVYQYAFREYAKDDKDQPMERIGAIRRARMKEVYDATFDEKGSTPSKKFP